MKTWDKINVEQRLVFEDFYTLFNQLPLLTEEKESLNEFYQMYITFVDAETKPLDAWKAIKGIFVIKNPQIQERINK